MSRRLGSAASLRATALAPRLLAAWLLAACNAASGPQPQQASFPPGERVTKSGAVSLELHEAHYDLRQVSLTVSLTNRSKAPVSLARDGILLAYGELQFPVRQSDAAPVETSTTLPPGGTVKLELGFGTEQLMIEAGTLHLLSLRTGDDWLAPLHLTVPPPAAFVEAAAQAQADEDEDEDP
jgi:hypothetical protein